MKQEEFDEQFARYREYLQQEIKRLNNFISVYLLLQERKSDKLDVLNMAPAFFQTVESALFTSIILWIDKMLDEDGERGIFNFLTFVEYNCRWLSVAELQRRNNYPDGHWMLQNRIEITPKSVEEDRAHIRELRGLQSFRIRRDKFHGHFDKRYFFDRERIASDAPINKDDLENALKIMGEILNRYSVEFDGSLQSWKALNINDLNELLNNAEIGKAQM